MSNFELTDLGDGRFALLGDMSFQTANRILKASARPFGGFDSLHLDLSKVDKADSAGLALLLEWKAQAVGRAASIRFEAIPESILAIARTSGVTELISQGSV
jgi:phospholipid transport system transporter-binding protein